MKEIVDVVMNNGLGVASFVALLYFIFHYVNKMDASLQEMTKTLVQIQVSLSQLPRRKNDIKEED